jgi:hypothetical protein
MKILSLFLFALFMFSPEVTSNKTINETSPSEFLHKLEMQYGEMTMHIAFFSIEEIRPYSILQNEATVSKYSNTWVAPAEYLSLLDDSEKQELDTSVAQYIQDFNAERKEKVYSKIANYLYTYTIFENLFLANDNDFKLKMFRTLRTMNVTRVAFEHVSTLGEFTVANLGSPELNQAKVKAYNKISDLDEQSRLLYYSEFFKNISKM